MSKLVASNTFTEGLMKDTNPLTTPNTVLTDCLNGTTITYNGKEFVLQNDMGNAIVETASLKRGYIPIGLKEYGGIIYVVSYNPLDNRVEFGSFPSPERDFTGDDFDTDDFTGFSVEGCRLSTSDFYDPNFKHPSLQSLIESEIGESNPDIDSAVPDPIIEETLSPSLLLPPPSATIPLFNDTITYNDQSPIGLGIEDFWTIDTQNSQPKFNLIKNYIVDDFSAYENLRLNTGDRFVVYYIDKSSEIDPNYNNIVESIIKLYVSNDTTRKLFKIDVYAVSNYGRKKLDIDPLLLKQSDLVPVAGNTSYLSGDLNEQVDYSIYNFDNNGIIEVRISLERPEFFNVHFRQYPNLTPSVKFITSLTNSSLMQIKGFKYSFKYLNDQSAAINGLMYYTQNTLYKLEGQYYTKNNKENSIVLMDNLSVGTYSYEVLPFTQYGYEYELLKKGTFDVSNDLTTSESAITLNEFYWTYTLGLPTSFDLHFITTLSISPDQTITDVYAELYDVWSNCSTYIDLTDYVDPMDPTLVLYDETFYLNGSLRAKGNYFPTNSNAGSTHGISYNDLTTSTKLKLPTASVNYQNRIQMIDPASGYRSLRKNHFYILAIYYKYNDSVLNQDFETGIYRYVYTNNEFSSYIGSTVNFSQVSYPEQTITLSLVLSVSADDVITSVNSYGPVLDQNTLLFDPSLQTYNTTTSLPDTKVLTGYAIGPDSFYRKYTNNKSVHIDSTLRNNFTLKRYYEYLVNGNNLVTSQDNLPGDLNTNILLVENIEDLIVNPDNTARLANLTYGSSGGSDPENHIFGETEALRYTIGFTKGTNKITLSLSSLYFNIESNKVFPYISENFYNSKSPTNEVRLLYPLFFQASEEIVNQILYGYQLNQTQYLPGATYLSDSKIYHQNLGIRHYSPAIDYIGAGNLYDWWNAYFSGNSVVGNQTITLSSKIEQQKIADSAMQTTGLYTNHYTDDDYKYLYSYQIVDVSCFKNDNTVFLETDLHRNTFSWGLDHITTTKLQYDPTSPTRVLSGLSMWKGKQLRAVANNGLDVSKVYTLIRSNSVYPIPYYAGEKYDCFEVSESFQLLNLFLFFGSYTENNDGYYKMYYVKNDYFACESNSSYVKYESDVDFNANIVSDYCFRIMFGAQNRMIILREDDDDLNLLTYIYSRFNFSTDGSNPEMFPKSMASNLNYSFAFDIDIYPAINMSTQTNTKITEAYNAVTNTHTIYNPLLTNTLGNKKTISRGSSSDLLSGGYINTAFNNNSLLYLIDPDNQRPTITGVILHSSEPTTLVNSEFGDTVHYYYTKFNSTPNELHALFISNDLLV